MDNELIFLQLSSLEKVFLDEDLSKIKEKNSISALKGERISYQILFTGGKERKTKVFYSFKADKRLSPEIRMVGNVPCAMPAYKNHSDEFYIRKEPGLFPDVLYPMNDDSFDVVSDSKHALFITVEIPADIEAGVYPVEISFRTEKNEYKKVFSIKILDAKLPKQELIYTQWLHADCIANYYKFDIFSEEHWNMIDKFIETAAHCGINMILTPVFTLPLDTEIGRERTTLQLADIYFSNGAYEFGFSKLKRWIEICRRHGINRFEISHLFSQWGTGCTPKIEAETPQGRKKIFGWHTKALSEEYKAFLKEFISALSDFLKSESVYENTYFHVSDEPEFDRDLEIYKAEKSLLSELVPEEKIMDAISHYEFCELGIVKKPIVITSSVDKFFERGITDIWAYYCCGPAADGYSNRYISMPSGRNRICGAQLYKYGISGFLHWGYNFYYSQLSKREINPFLVTDADESFPPGDAFSVYPGENGPLESIRSVVFFEALQDIRAFKLLESFIGKNEVDALIEADGKISFNEFPRSNSGVENIRKRVNKKIEEIISEM